MLKELIEREEVNVYWINNPKFSKLVNKELCSKLANFKWNLPNHDSDWKIWIENNYTEILVKEFPDEYHEMLNSLLIIYGTSILYIKSELLKYIKLHEVYKCVCGKEFYIANSYNGHKRHCKLSNYLNNKIPTKAFVNHLGIHVRGNHVHCKSRKSEEKINKLYSIKNEVINLFLNGKNINEIKELINIKVHRYYYSDILVTEFGYDKYHRLANDHKNEKNSIILYNKISNGVNRYNGSYPEELLGDILFKINIYYIRQLSLKAKRRYYADYYLPDYNIILECDGNFKYFKDDLDNYVLQKSYLDRKHDIEGTLGIRVINIKENMIYYYNSHKKDLLNLINKLEYPPIII